MRKATRALTLTLTAMISCEIITLNLIKMEKAYLRKKLKHTNFDGVIHYGRNGEKKINLIDLLKDYKQQLIIADVVKQSEQ